MCRVRLQLSYVYFRIFPGILLTTNQPRLWCVNICKSKLYGREQLCGDSRLGCPNRAKARPHQVSA